MEKISIIIPVYNVEEHLQQCLESIVNQTYKNIEVILVNDGSTDKSPVICDEFAMRDKRIKVVHKNNEGVSSARNNGLDISTGEYIGFVDSDDWIEPNMFEELLMLIKMHNSDIAICGYSIVNNHSFVLSDQRKITKQINNNETLKEVFLGSVKGFLWNKLFDKKVFQDIRFPEELDFCEDMYTISNLLTRKRKVVYTSKILYNYKQNSNSITNDVIRYFDMNNSLKMLNVLNEIKKMYQNNKEVLKYIDLSSANAVLFTFSKLLDIENDKNSQLEKFEHLGKNLRKYYKIYMLSKSVSFKEKLRYSVLMITPGFYAKFRRKRNKEKWTKRPYL